MVLGNQIPDKNDTQDALEELILVEAEGACGS